MRAIDISAGELEGSRVLSVKLDKKLEAFMKEANQSYKIVGFIWDPDLPGEFGIVVQDKT